MSESNHSAHERLIRRVALALVAVTGVAGLAYAAGAMGPGPRGTLGSGSPAEHFGSAPGGAQPGLLSAVGVQAGPGVTLTARLDRSRILQGGDGLVRAELTLAAAPADGAREAAPTDVIVLLDRSSSMSGAKFEDARMALLGLLDRLRPADRLALVTYSSGAEINAHLAPATAARVVELRQLVRGLQPGGSTNISAALDRADALVRQRQDTERPARVLLLSDGEPTAGETGDGALVERARSAARVGYVLGTVGIGLGFNEILMAALADAGTGNFHSLHGEGGVEAILAAEFDAARGTVASALAVELSPADGVQVVDAAGYPLERAGHRATFRPGALFAGQQRRIWVTLKVPVDRPLSEVSLGGARLRFVRDGITEQLDLASVGQITAVADEAQFVAGLAPAVWEKSVVEGRFAAIEKALAVHVRDGDADAARALLDSHAAQTVALNRVVGSAAVEAHLGEVARRRAALDDAFRGADQAHKRNVFSKLNTASGWSRSRGGSLGSR